MFAIQEYCLLFRFQLKVFYKHCHHKFLEDGFLSTSLNKQRITKFVEAPTLLKIVLFILREPGPRMSPCPAGTEPSAWHADPSPC
jgi:hypothetical protein